MAKKKRVTKKKGVSRKTVSHKSDSFPARIRIAWRNLVLFVILFLASYLLYTFSNTNLFSTFFGITSIILGFVSLSFLIALMVLLVSRSKK
ncbi:MAG: hypothetical protein KKC19_02705 [Nanoarchaeota archaeon]|nr:hypothetical protein [Nanoarchaeota archaeon]